MPYVIFKNDVMLEYHNIVELPSVGRCAKYLGVSRRTANRRLVNSKKHIERYIKLDESVKYGIEYFREGEIK